jgi:hypothetical protein
VVAVIYLVGLQHCVALRLPTQLVIADGHLCPLLNLLHGSPCLVHITTLIFLVQYFENVYHVYIWRRF